MLKAKKGASAIIIILAVLIVVLIVAVALLAVKVFKPEIFGSKADSEQAQKEDDVKSEVNIEEKEEQKQEENESVASASKYHMNIKTKEAFLYELPSGDKMYARIGSRTVTMYDFTLGKDGMNVTASLDEGKNLVTISAIDADGNLVVENTINCGTDKLDEIALEPYGQSGTNYILILLMNDGTIQYIDVFDALMSEAHEAKKVEGLKDIIRVDHMSADALIPIALDINGKYYKITEYTGILTSNSMQDFVKKYKK